MLGHGRHDQFLLVIETPGIQGNRDIIGEGIMTSKVKIDDARQLVLREKHIIREKIGMNDCLVADSRGMLAFSWVRVASMRSRSGV